MGLRSITPVSGFKCKGVVLILYLGKGHVRGLQFELESQEAVLWVREGDDFQATLVSDKGPLLHTAVQDEWRIFVLPGPGEWRATFLGPKKAPETVFVGVRCTDQGKVLTVF